jgi:hypothetical protein
VASSKAKTGEKEKETAGQTNEEFAAFSYYSSARWPTANCQVRWKTPAKWRNGRNQERVVMGMTTTGGNAGGIGRS